EPIVEIEIAAEVRDVPKVGQPQRVAQPRSAVKHWHAAHPIGMLVEDQQVEWLAQAAQESKRHVVEIAGAVQSQPRIVRAAVEQLVTRTLETIESSKGTGNPNAWAPVSETYHPWIVKTPRTTLG